MRTVIRGNINKNNLNKVRLSISSAYDLIEWFDNNKKCKEASNFEFQYYFDIRYFRPRELAARIFDLYIHNII